MTVLSTRSAEALDRALAQSSRIAAVHIDQGAVSQTGALYRAHLGNAPAFIVADDNTYAAAGAAVEAALCAAGVSHRKHILGGTPQPKPARELADHIATLRRPGEQFVALGSGVLNDLVKYAAFTGETDYLCVATATSMDGYSSAGAPLTEAGFKKTLACRAPRVIVADMDVLAAAPPEMTGWGYADLAGKVPAGADWILADALGVEPIHPRAWALVQDDLRSWLSAATEVGSREPGALSDLFVGLALVGFAMEVHGSSRPASGADHQIAHLWEMEGLHHNGHKVSHGACVAVGSLAVLALYDWLLAQDLTALDTAACLAAQPDRDHTLAAIHTHFPDPGQAARAEIETAQKTPTPEELEARLERLRAQWPALRTRLRAQLLPMDDLAALLRRAGAPGHPRDIGLTPQDLRSKVLAARYFRSRYTILDLLAETGLTEPALAAMTRALI